ncbi:MAG: hypothetical protein LDL13_00960 [Calditerrivibrio sp.]|nr:hypothetical protein [Calditerrivibrio sp.]MCA1932130.1 hypothetical protein [Calditerrivibrio sp.]
MKSRDLLLEYIKKYGSVKGYKVNVEYFLNHRVDPSLLETITDDFLLIINNMEFDKIMTAESSGIALATSISLKTGKPFVYLKKKKPSTMDDHFSVESFSFTKNETIKLFLSKSCINRNEKIIFVDDFFANGNTFNAVNRLKDVAGFQLVGYFVVINKSLHKNIFSILNKNDMETILNEIK